MDVINPVAGSYTAVLSMVSTEGAFTYVIETKNLAFTIIAPVFSPYSFNMNKINSLPSNT